MALKILICDDAGFVREILHQALLELGHVPVGEAKDGVEAVRAADRLKPDVVLIDLVLPLRNGAEAAREIMERLPSARLVAMSTVDEEFLSRKAAEIGFHGILPKPFSKSQLKDVLDDLQNRFGAKEARHG